MSKQVTTLAEAFKALEIDSYIWVKTDLVKAKVSPTVYECDNHILISAEDGKDIADYYGECRGGYPYICEELEALADKLGVIIEWQDAGTLSIYPE